ncbi:unnamed protein product [Calypogeia fissa]
MSEDRQADNSRETTPAITASKKQLTSAQISRRNCAKNFTNGKEQHAVTYLIPHGGEAKRQSNSERRGVSVRQKCEKKRRESSEEKETSIRRESALKGLRTCSFDQSAR